MFVCIWKLPGDNKPSNDSNGRTINPRKVRQRPIAYIDYIAYIAYRAYMAHIAYTAYIAYIV